MAQECWEQESHPSSHSSSRLCCRHRSRDQARARGSHTPKEDQSSIELSGFFGRADSLLGTHQRAANHIPVAPNFLISNRDPVCKLRSMGCHQHRAGSEWFQSGRLRSGAKGFSSLKRDNFNVEGLARLKLPAKLYHSGFFFIPRPQILSSHLTIALQAIEHQVPHTGVSLQQGDPCCSYGNRKSFALPSKHRQNTILKKNTEVSYQKWKTEVFQRSSETLFTIFSDWRHLTKLIKISELPLSAQGVFLDIKEEKFDSVKKNVPTSTKNGDNFSIV